MKEKTLIIVKEIETKYGVDSSFMDNLESYEHITFIIKDSNRYVYSDQLPIIERIIRLHYDLEINMEGIEVINRMLTKMESLQETIRVLENKLHRYE